MNKELTKDEMINELRKMMEHVDKEYSNGEISWEEKESRQAEIMQTWRVIQP